MQATETKLRKLVEGTQQYVVPLFQRPYSWSEKQWKTLWTDILEKSRHEDGRPHFFGSIVTTPAKSVPQGVGKYLLIDGQQRITTIQVLLAAVRDLAGRSGNTTLHDRIDGQYLTNQYEQGEERLKVLPTQADRAAFGAIIRQEEGPKTALFACYQFFVSRLDRLDRDQLEAIHKAVVDGFSLVSIVCDEHDNPHLIFESLNAKGEKLTPADLIRNFLLMRVHVGEQERLFKTYWLPIQEALDGDLTEFVRHYLMKEGKILKEADVYFELKDRLAHSSPVQAESFLKDLHRHGLYYASFLNAKREADDDLARKLDRIRRLKVTVAYPFLLRVFDAYNAESLSRDQLFQTLDLLEAFVVRRAICNLPTNQLRRMLPPVFDAAGGAGPAFIDGLRRELSGKRCPDDEAFAASLASEPLYSSADKIVRLRLILERLEQSFDHKEPVRMAGATIEHVLPQEMTSEWKLELGDDAASQSNQLLHTLGNLTLTGYNAELSNKPYSVKRGELLKSHFDLNLYFAEIERWTPDAIRARGRSLAARALRIWEDVGRSTAPGDLKPPANRRPVKVRFRGVEQPVTNWKDAFVKLLTQFEAASPGLLNRLATEETLNSVLAVDEAEFQRSKARIGLIYVNTHASASQLQKWCRKIAEKGRFDPTEFEFVM
ncbi:DUF262 domain-containing protein [Paludisphaera borealis]|uniref:DUF262 domain-containing protein n=1 Tax=Paludisphaera borealis TaxID=1387353 RepID=A0A1U7CUQ8_9BACT|nr:DUF262 domain-containing protein [Paludisphaera borealis]APW62661.1 hypothetical protein BSF38_04211 [Paludisphaera borealis]